ncbi:hypothetical protein ADUPG1_008063, partial [Aduncisulcus paluster]
MGFFGEIFKFYGHICKYNTLAFLGEVLFSLVGPICIILGIIIAPSATSGCSYKSVGYLPDECQLAMRTSEKFSQYQKKTFLFFGIKQGKSYPQYTSGTTFLCIGFLALAVYLGHVITIWLSANPPKKHHSGREMKGDKPTPTLSTEYQPHKHTDIEVYSHIGAASYGDTAQPPVIKPSDVHVGDPGVSYGMDASSHQSQPPVPSPSIPVDPHHSPVTNTAVSYGGGVPDQHVVQPGAVTCFARCGDLKKSMSFGTHNRIMSTLRENIAERESDTFISYVNSLILPISSSSETPTGESFSKCIHPWMVDRKYVESYNYVLSLIDKESIQILNSSIVFKAASSSNKIFNILLCINPAYFYPVLCQITKHYSEIPSSKQIYKRRITEALAASFRRLYPKKFDQKSKDMPKDVKKWYMQRNSHDFICLVMSFLVLDSLLTQHHTPSPPPVLGELGRIFPMNTPLAPETRMDSLILILKGLCGCFCKKPINAIHLLTSMKFKRSSSKFTSPFFTPITSIGISAKQYHNDQLEKGNLDLISPFQFKYSLHTTAPILPRLSSLPRFFTSPLSLAAFIQKTMLIPELEYHQKITSLKGHRMSQSVVSDSKYTLSLSSIHPHTPHVTATRTRRMRRERGLSSVKGLDQDLEEIVQIVKKRIRVILTERGEFDAKKIINGKKSETNEYTESILDYSGSVKPLIPSCPSSALLAEIYRSLISPDPIFSSSTMSRYHDHQLKFILVCICVGLAALPSSVSDIKMLEEVWTCKSDEEEDIIGIKSKETSEDVIQSFVSSPFPSSLPLPLAVYSRWKHFIGILDDKKKRKDRSGTSKPKKSKKIRKVPLIAKSKAKPKESDSKDVSMLDKFVYDWKETMAEGGFTSDSSNPVIEKGICSFRLRHRYIWNRGKFVRFPSASEYIMLNSFMKDSCNLKYGSILPSPSTYLCMSPLSKKTTTESPKLSMLDQALSLLSLSSALAYIPISLCSFDSLISSLPRALSSWLLPIVLCFMSGIISEKEWIKHDIVGIVMDLLCSMRNWEIEEAKQEQIRLDEQRARVWHKMHVHIDMRDDVRRREKEMWEEKKSRVMSEHPIEPQNPSPGEIEMSSPTVFPTFSPVLSFGGTMNLSSSQKSIKQLSFVDSIHSASNEDSPTSSPSVSATSLAYNPRLQFIRLYFNTGMSSGCFGEESEPIRPGQFTHFTNTSHSLKKVHKVLLPVLLESAKKLHDKLDSEQPPMSFLPPLESFTKILPYLSPSSSLPLLSLVFAVYCGQLLSKEHNVSPSSFSSTIYRRILFLNSNLKPVHTFSVQPLLLEAVNMITSRRQVVITHMEFNTTKSLCKHIQKNWRMAHKQKVEEVWQKAESDICRRATKTMILQRFWKKKKELIQSKHSPISILKQKKENARTQRLEEVKYVILAESLQEKEREDIERKKKCEEELLELEETARLEYEEEERLKREEEEAERKRIEEAERLKREEEEQRLKREEEEAERKRIEEAERLKREEEERLERLKREEEEEAERKRIEEAEQEEAERKRIEEAERLKREEEERLKREEEEAERKRIEEAERLKREEEERLERLK